MSSNELESRKLKTEIWKNIISCVAIIAGGFWALYTFSRLEESYFSSISISEKESSFLSIETTMSVAELNSLCNEKIGLEVIVNFENKGIYPVEIDLGKKATFGVAILGDGLDEKRFQKVNGFYTAKPYGFYFATAWGIFSNITIPPKVKISVPYFVQVDKPGTYFVSFRSELSEDAQDKLNKNKIEGVSLEYADLHSWSTQKYIVIKGGNDGSNKEIQQTQKTRC